MIIENETGKLNRGGVKRMKKKSLLIDMTPMVDLGFILITFFIYTTQLARPTAMKIAFPKDGEVMPAPESKSMTILLDRDRFYYYFGTEEEAHQKNWIRSVSLAGENNLRVIIQKKQMLLQQNSVDRKDFFILIRPSKNSSYKNVMDVLDEMLINGVSRYAILEPGERDKKYMEEFK